MDQYVQCETPRVNQVCKIFLFILFFPFFRLGLLCDYVYCSHVLLKFKFHLMVVLHLCMQAKYFIFTVCSIVLKKRRYSSLFFHGRGKYKNLDVLKPNFILIIYFGRCHLHRNHSNKSE